MYYSNICLEAIKDEIIRFPDPEHEKMMDRESLINLLNSAFVFGSEPGANSIFWDLKSYDEKDKSCDIYWANSDCFDGNIYKIGRDFYEFITEFCLGTKSYEILPEEEWVSQEDIQQNFTRVRWYGSSPYLWIEELSPPE